jgi:hypothetical protein
MKIRLRISCAHGRRAHGDTGGLQISGGGLPANACFLLNAAQRPAELPQRDYLFLFVFAQDIVTMAELTSARVNVPGTLSLAGFG